MDAKYGLCPKMRQLQYMDGRITFWGRCMGPVIEQGVQRIRTEGIV
jgi:hypothetical protein